jgi:NTE family protein
MSGLVLGGGGGKGGYHIGAWKALRELGIEIEAVTGTSVGALNGSFIAQGKFQEALDIWENISPEQLMEIDGDHFNDLINFKLKLTLENIETTMKLAEKHFKNKGISVQPLREMIEEHVDESKMRESEIDFGLVTVNLTDLKPMELFIKDIPEGKVPEYMLASSFLPTFESMELDGKLFLDGGFHDNLPINMMLAKGIEEIIAVDLNAIGIRKHVKNKSAKIKMIQPSGDLGKILEFDSGKSRRNISMGYLDTLKVFGKLDGHRYFMTGLPEDDYFVRLLAELTIEDMKLILNEMGIKGKPTHRNLFEQGVPEIARLLGIREAETYRDLLVRMIEIVADQLEIERLWIYQYHEIVGLLLDKKAEADRAPQSSELLEQFKKLIMSSDRRTRGVRVAFKILEMIDAHNMRQVELS